MACSSQGDASPALFMAGRKEVSLWPPRLCRDVLKKERPALALSPEGLGGRGARCGG